MRSHGVRRGLVVALCLGAACGASATQLWRARSVGTHRDIVEPAAVATPAPSPQIVFNYYAANIVADPVRPRVYASLPNANSVLVIDTNTFSVTTIPIGSSPRGLALSADNSKLWVANSGSSNFAVGIIDLDRLAPLPSLPAPALPLNLIEGPARRLYVNSGSSNPGIMIIDSDSGQYLGSLTSPYAYDGFVDVTPDRNTLLYGNAGISASTLDKFDISTVPGAPLQETHNLGSNGESLRISHSGAWFVYPNGSGNGSGYSTFEVPVANINSVNCSFNVGAYPNAATFSNDDTLLYHGASGFSGRVMTFETCFGTLLGSFDLPNSDVIKDVVVDRTGQWLFVVTGRYSSSPTGDIRVFSTGRTDPIRPFPNSVASRKMHGNVAFDLPLPISCTLGVECRAEGGAHHIVFRFPTAVTVAGASVIPGSGGSAEIDGQPIPSPDKIEVTVNLKNVSNAQRLTVTLNGVNDGVRVGDVPVTFGVLAGDTNGDGIVNSADISQTKSQSGQPISASDVREDLNLDGAINSADVSLVKSRSGTGLP